MKLIDGKIQSKSLRSISLIWSETSFLLLVVSPMLDLSLQSIEIPFWKDGRNFLNPRKSLTQMISLSKEFLEILFLLESGVFKVSQLMISQLKMVSSRHKQKDGHCLLIHSLKPINGLSQWKKIIIFKQSSCLILNSFRL